MFHFRSHNKDLNDIIFTFWILSLFFFMFSCWNLKMFRSKTISNSFNVSIDVSLLLFTPKSKKIYKKLDYVGRKNDVDVEDNEKK